MKLSVYSRRAGRHHQTGVGMIEVLVAVLVVSIGFLGVAALQATSLSTNNSAMARSMATVASYSILDAMRMDRADALAGSYNGPVPADDCPAAGSTLASVQLNQWCQQLGQHLGQAGTTGQITCVATAAATATTAAQGYCTVTITFDDTRAGTNAASATNQTVRTKAAI